MQTAQPPERPHRNHGLFSDHYLDARLPQRSEKLLQLRFAGSLDDLRVPPGNRLEKLSGDRANQHSIRINRQYRVCFVWGNGDAHDVEIVDYH